MSRHTDKPVRLEGVYQRIVVEADDGALREELMLPRLTSRRRYISARRHEYDSSARFSELLKHFQRRRAHRLAARNDYYLILHLADLQPAVLRAFVELRNKALADKVEVEPSEEEPVGRVVEALFDSGAYASVIL